MKRADLQWIVQRYRDHVSRRSLVARPDVTTFLADDRLPDVLQRMDEAVR